MYIYILVYVYICTLTRIYTFIFYTLILSLYIPGEFNHPAPKRNPRGIKNGQIGIGAPNSTQIDVQLKVWVRPKSTHFKQFRQIERQGDIYGAEVKRLAHFIHFPKQRREYLCIYIYIYILLRIRNNKCLGIQTNILMFIRSNMRMKTARFAKNLKSIHDKRNKHAPAFFTSAPLYPVTR